MVQKVRIGKLTSKPECADVNTNEFLVELDPTIDFVAGTIAGESIDSEYGIWIVDTAKTGIAGLTVGHPFDTG